MEKKKDIEFNKKIKKLLFTKRLNILLGSGVSKPAIPTLDDDKNNNIALLDKIKKVSKDILKNEMDDKKNETLNNYKKFICSLVNVLYKSNSREIPKSINIFTRYIIVLD